MKKICGLDVVMRFYSHRHKRYEYWVEGKLPEYPIELEIYGDENFIAKKVAELRMNANILRKLIPVLRKISKAKALSVRDDDEHGKEGCWWWFVRAENPIYLSIRGWSIALAGIEGYEKIIEDEANVKLIPVAKSGKYVGIYRVVPLS